MGHFPLNGAEKSHEKILSFCNHYIKLSQYIKYGKSYLEILITGHLFSFTDIKNNS